MAKKYIDTEKLIAEIRKLRSESCISEGDDYYEFAKSEIINIITSLQQEQPEVNLEKEIKKYFDGWYDGDEYGQAIMGASRNHYCACVDDCKDIARHFFELGLNARK